MSKKKLKRKLGVFLGLSAAHRILAEHTHKKESIIRVQQEADNYRNLVEDINKGNWNEIDLKEIKEIARKRCLKKLNQYEDTSSERYSKIDNEISNLMEELEVKQE